MTHPQGTFPVYVIEGPDCAGKTTLADAMVKYLNAEYLHLTYRFKDRMDKYHTAALEYVLKKAEQGPVILDRWWMSEIAYAAAFRGGTAWKRAGRMLDSVAQKHAFTYILCLPYDRDAYIEHHARSKEKRYADKPWALRGRNEKTDTMSPVYDAFADIEEWMGVRSDVIVYDFMTHGQDLEFACERIHRHASDRNAVLPLFLTARMDRRYCGPSDPDFVLIGDRSNPKGRHTTWPFVEHAHSSLWLHNFLEKQGIYNSQVGFMNPYTMDGRLWISKQMLDHFDSVGATLIPMGGQAREAMTSWERLPEGPPTLHHPSYYRRFGEKGLDKLVDQMKPFQRIGYPHDAAKRIGL